MGLEMNGVSQGLLNAGNVISHYSAVFLILAAASDWLHPFFQPYRKRSRSSLRKLVTHLPIFREIPVAMDYSRLAQGLSLGLRSGLSPETSLELTEAMLTQPELLTKAPENLRTSERTGKLFQKRSDRVRTVQWHGGTSDQCFLLLRNQ